MMLKKCNRLEWRKAMQHVDRLIAWNKLKRVKSVKFVNKTFFWFSIVPIFVKIIGLLRKYSFGLYYGDFLNSFHLPFSWAAYYFGALFFMIGNIVFYFFCPSIIFDNDSFAANNISLVNIKKYCDDLRMPFQERTVSSDNYNDFLEKRFWDVYVQANMKKKVIRHMIGIVYLIGFIIIIFVSSQSISSVIKFVM
jgi:hypothetical protein